MNGRRKVKNRTHYIRLAVFLLVMALTAAFLLFLITAKPNFGTIFDNRIGNGIYNTFFINGSGTSQTEISIRGATAENGPVVDEATRKLFGSVEHSQNAVLMRISDMAVIYEKNGRQVNFPASLTKVMAALVAIDHITDYEEIVTITQENINYTIRENASVAGFSPGEEIKVRDLLYGSLIASGADASIAISHLVTGIEDIAAAEEAFVNLMNKKADSLGLIDTHFMNSTGLHDPKHYSTAYEMALIFAEAVKTPFLRDIMTTAQYTIAPTNIHKNGITVKSTVVTSFNRAKLDMGVILGGKTGYTPEAKLCLASVASVDAGNGAEDFILITLSAGDGTYDTQYNVMDAYAVFNSVAETGEE